MNKQRGFAGFVFLVWFMIFVPLVIGWCMNVYKLVIMPPIDWANIQLILVLRLVGIFVAPLGGVLGYF